MQFKRIILSFVADAASDSAPIHQLREKSMSRIITTLSESEQSQSVASFIMDKVVDNISFQLAIHRYFLSDVDNCDLDLTCGGEKRVKVMIRKLNSKDGVASKVIYIRGLVSDDSGSNSRVSSIDIRDELKAHLLCYPDGKDMEIHICASDLQLAHFLSNSSESEEEEELEKVILITLDEDNSVVKIHDDPDMNEIKEFTKNDKKATFTNASNKSGKRKATSTDSEKPNKNAKTTAAEPEQTEEAPKTPEKTTTDTDEPPTVETTKKSSKKSKKSPKKSKKAKDPDAPKRPLTAYMKWSNANRSRIVEDHPDLDFGGIAKETSKQWKKIPADEKATLEAAYQKEKKKFDSEKPNKNAKTTAAEPEQAKEAPKTPEKTTTDKDEPPTVETTKKSSKKSKNSSKKSKKAKDPNEPEKPLTAFFRWSHSNRDRIKKNNPDLAFGDLSKEMGKQWKKVPAEEKTALKAAYEEEKKKYDKQIEKYNKKNGDSDKSKKTADQAVNASESTPSTKNGKRKATSTDSEKPNKNAKTTAAEPEQTEEAPKTPEKTTTDTDEPPTVETTQKSSKKSKNSPKKSKKAKDPDAPKRPLTAYMKWSNANRSRIAEDHPNLDFGGIAKETSKQWKKIPADEKATLEAAYQKEKKKYDKQIEKYNKKKKNSSEAK